MNKLSDNKLFDLYRSGNEEAFNILYERYKPKLFVFLRNMLSYKEPDEIGEYIQEIFIKVIKKAGSFKRRYAFSTWIYKIARNHVYDIYRKDKGNFSISGEEHDLQVVICSQEDKYHILSCLNKLPLEQKEVILLRAEGFSFKEIASILFIPKNTAITRNARGIEKLKEYLNEV